MADNYYLEAVEFRVKQFSSNYSGGLGDCGLCTSVTLVKTYFPVIDVIGF